MTIENRPVRTGGCQCGAVRFRVEGAPSHASICHCRMCQKAFGAFYAPLLNLGRAKLTWTRGAPAHFRSSETVRRGFCQACGTPLTFEASDETALAIGAFDDPSDLAPTRQFGVENRLAFVDHLAELPAIRTEDDPDVPAGIRSLQHPDHDTPDP